MDTVLPRGLTGAEAHARLAAEGPNRAVPRSRLAGLRELVATLGDPMALMLAAAATLYLLLGQTRDGLILLGALVPVLAIDVLLEARSRRALKALARAVAPRACVVRDGREQLVPTDDLVRGDLLCLREGDLLHADGVVRSAANLAVDESPLTGESEPQPKERDAPFFAGSRVLAGAGLGEVTATGARTRFGEIARLVATSQAGRTPLEQATDGVVHRLALVAAAVAVAVSALALARGEAMGAALLSGITLAMAALPEEFPLVLTLFLSLGAWRLSRLGVLVRRLSAVETLGAASVICSDKTGTLTEGRFALDAWESMDSTLAPRELLEAAVLACETAPVDPIERALVERARTEGVDAATLHARWRLARDHDFDPVGKHMTHAWVARGDDGAARVVAKGALEGVLEHCDATPSVIAAAEAANARLASQGMRVLAVAERRVPSPSPPRAGNRADDERGLRLVGLLGFRDPVRPEVPSLIARCRGAGVRVVMITGDHPATARAIAAAAGLPHDERDVVTGADLDARGAAAASLASLARDASIFARTRPEQKHAIVDALVRAGETVAMIGDGINDAPALRRASIGISLGKRGTEVARAAADLVLVDDRLETLVDGIREGRRIFHNLRASFLYLVAFHVPIVLLALVVPLGGWPLVLLPVHMVWLELVVHPVSALLFEEDEPGDALMRQPPRRAGPLLPLGTTLRAAVTGVLIAIAALAQHVLALDEGEARARGGAMLVLVLGSVLLAWAERAQGRSWGTLVRRGSVRFWIVSVLVAASAPVVLAVPSLATTLHVAAPPARGIALAIGLAIASVGWRAILDPWLAARPARRAG